MNSIEISFFIFPQKYVGWNYSKRKFEKKKIFENFFWKNQIESWMVVVVVYHEWGIKLTRAGQLNETWNLGTKKCAFFLRLTFSEEFRCFTGSGGGISSGVRDTGGMLTGLLAAGVVDKSLVWSGGSLVASRARTDAVRCTDDEADADGDGDSRKTSSWCRAVAVTAAEADLMRIVPPLGSSDGDEARWWGSERMPRWPRTVSSSQWSSSIAESLLSSLYVTKQTSACVLWTEKSGVTEERVVWDFATSVLVGKGVQTCTKTGWRWRLKRVTPCSPAINLARQSLRFIFV